MGAWFAMNVPLDQKSFSDGTVGDEAQEEACFGLGNSVSVGAI